MLWKPYPHNQDENKYLPLSHNRCDQVSFEFVKMVSASTIADVELKLSSMENGKGLIDALNNKSE